MGRFKYEDPTWLRSSISFLNRQRAQGLKSIQTAEGSGAYLSYDETTKLLDEMIADLDGMTGVKPEEKLAVFKAHRILQGPL